MLKKIKERYSKSNKPIYIIHLLLFVLGTVLFIKGYIEGFSSVYIRPACIAGSLMSLLAVVEDILIKSNNKLNYLNNIVSIGIFIMVFFYN
ncbi:hypothetical protein [Neobacillus ginsengisoli]|uniref:EamA domain-containing protein n=1 Tax=Neobacillus ginsengisoli TaxID=904295 RepID=A0ABT9Y3G4_9BACI|nr:hypothetical protein [Neobacillus ginsengisoli]MDQ0202299.1 hypothetical protein [Neobacillus ginsengisoli]